MRDFTVAPAGDSALSVSFGQEIREDLNARVVALDRALRDRPLPGVAETIPTYSSLLVCYDPARVGYRSLAARIARLARGGSVVAANGGRTFVIPVLYGGDHGEDLPDVAARAGLSEAEVVERHSGRDYLIYMLGFLPGFAYLGGLDPAIATPRLATPRAAIPAGSVGIGGEQTGIYPLRSPGGWRLIGATPVKPYDPARAEPILYRAGDRIRFAPIGAAEFASIRERVEAGEYRCAVGGGEA
jgi:KipI family sensor histidine kinase inhibitor